MTWTDAQNWLDIVDHLWIGLVLIAVAGVPSWFAARNKKAINSVYDSINNRPTSIRDDMDAMHTDLYGIRDEMRGGFTAIRADINEERQARRSGDQAIRAEIERHHPST